MTEAIIDRPEVPGQPDVIGRVAYTDSNTVVFEYIGDEVVTELSDLNITEPPAEHYADSRELYEPATAEISQWLQSNELRVRLPDGTERELLPYKAILPFCEQVDVEYAATVTPRLVLEHGNPDHHVPELDTDQVYNAYVALSTGNAAVLPTSVGNIVATASPRALRTMFLVKNRPLAKVGVVLTTMDQIPEMAEIPEGWEDYLRHMHTSGILTGSKLPRNPDHALFKNQANQDEWWQNASMQPDGTSMFVFLPGPYSDVIARILASEGIVLTASSANKSTEGNNRDIAKLHSDIKRGTGYTAWDPEAVSAYPLNEARESQGVMVDFGWTNAGDGYFHVIRGGFMHGAFELESAAYFREHPEFRINSTTYDIENMSGVTKK